MEGQLPHFTQVPQLGSRYKRMFLQAYSSESPDASPREGGYLALFDLTCFHPLDVEKRLTNLATIVTPISYQVWK